jgi:hypothetical protein
MNEQTEVGAVPNLGDLAERDLRKMRKQDLLAVCLKAGLPATGEMSRNKLLTMAQSGKRGGQDHHVHGKTLCPIRCGGIAYVYALAGGKRYMRCNKCGYRFSRAIKA